MNVSKTKRQFVMLLLLIILSSYAPLIAEVLMFETSTGNISSFDLNVNESDKPSDYNVSTQYYGNSGFIGSLVYQGDPCILRFSNVGSNALQIVYNQPVLFY